MIWRGAIAALMAILVACPAAAQFSHASVTCALSATPLNFGIYDPTWPTPTDFSATITVTCTTPLAGPVPVSGTLMLSPGTSATPTVRRMAHDGAVLRYQIYVDSAYSMVWGDGTGTTLTIPVSGTSGRTQPLRQTFTAHGRLLARQGSAGVGAYQDLLTATLSY